MSRGAGVRIATVDDVDQVAQVQLAAWQAGYAEQLAGVELDAAGLARAWLASLSDPPSARHRLLVAHEGEQVVGLAASEPTGAAPLPEAELTLLLVAPGHGRRGHGSRLLAATVDLWREDGVGRGIAWVLETDQALEGFLAGAGWAPEPVQRDLAFGTVRGSQRRWHTAP